MVSKLEKIGEKRIPGFSQLLSKRLINFQGFGLSIIPGQKEHISGI